MGDLRKIVFVGMGTISYMPIGAANSEVSMMVVDLNGQGLRECWGMVEGLTKLGWSKGEDRGRLTKLVEGREQMETVFQAAFAQLSSKGGEPATFEEDADPRLVELSQVKRIEVPILVCVSTRELRGYENCDAPTLKSIARQWRRQAADALVRARGQAQYYAQQIAHAENCERLAEIQERVSLDMQALEDRHARVPDSPSRQRLERERDERETLFYFQIALRSLAKEDVRQLLDALGLEEHPKLDFVLMVDSVMQAPKEQIRAALGRLSHKALVRLNISLGLAGAHRCNKEWLLKLAQESLEPKKDRRFLEEESDTI